MDSNTFALNGGLTTTASRSFWIKSKDWDLTFISLSAVLVFVPLASYYFGQSQENNPGYAQYMSKIVDYFVAACIGGPHMFATFIRTFLNKGFVKDNKFVTYSSFLIPVMVIAIGIANDRMPILLTIFFTFASIHVVEQMLYLVDSYNIKARLPVPKWERFVDYFVSFSALAPWGVYMFVHDKFLIDSRVLLFPPFLKQEWLIYVTFAVFFLAVALFVYKTYLEIKEGRFNGPKTLLISLTVVIGFWIPSVGLVGIPLDVSFQGFNIWHSFQYLGVSAFILKQQYKKGLISSPFVKKLAKSGWYFYGFNVLVTWCLVGVMFLISPDIGFGLVQTDSQARYLPTLSFLLIHYYHDHFLFRDHESLVAAT
jgi:hypothetical protein